jgi:hypothetical protein
MTTPSSSSDVPSRASLLRSTLIALAVATVLLVTCVLPAEYGKDLTGVGRLLGLTQMGEVKLALAEEAASNAAAEASADSVIAAAEAGAESSEGATTAGGSSANGSPAGAAAADASTAGAVAAAPVLRVDTTLMTLPPNKGGEIKLVMPAQTRAAYRWTVTGGVVNFDMHGDSTNAPKDWFVSYRKGQGAAADSGELLAGFKGNHGWYWRNRGTGDVLIRLVTSGAYERVEKH